MNKYIDIKVQKQLNQTNEYGDEDGDEDGDGCRQMIVIVIVIVITDQSYLQQIDREINRQREIAGRDDSDRRQGYIDSDAWIDREMGDGRWEMGPGMAAWQKGWRADSWTGLPLC